MKTYMTTKRKQKQKIYYINLQDGEMDTAQGWIQQLNLESIEEVQALVYASILTEIEAY